MNRTEQVRDLIKMAGGPVKLSRLFNVTPQAIGLWYLDGPPAERVLPICEAAEFKVTPHQLRPDIYPHPQDGMPNDRRYQWLDSQDAGWRERWPSLAGKDK